MTFDDHYKQHGMEGARKYPNEPMLRFLATLPWPGSVLEIGCGTGANLWAIANEEFDTFGLDSSTRAIGLCSDFLKQQRVGATLSVGDFSSLPYDDKSFDAVIDVISVQHAENKTAVFKEVLRVLKDGGKFFTYFVSDGADMFPANYPIFSMRANDWEFLSEHFNITEERYIRRYADGNFVEYTALTCGKIGA